MFRILRAEKSALVVIEPPRQTRIATVLEVHDGVLIAVKKRGVELLGSRMSHPRIPELRIGVNGPPDEAGEVGGGRRSIKAVVVVEYAFEHGSVGKTYQLA